MKIKVIAIMLLYCSSVSFLLADIVRIEVSGEISGTIDIKLFTSVAPKHVAQIKQLVKAGSYNGVAFHRVIEGFMAQTGDILYGNIAEKHYIPSKVGTGGSSLSNIVAEFSDLPFQRGIVGMARSQDPNSANSQFFIMFKEAAHLNSQYTAVGKVLAGMDVVDKIKRGSSNGIVPGVPDFMKSVVLVPN